MSNNNSTTTTTTTIPEQQWTFAQKATIAIAPKISSSLSIFGSSYIIYRSVSNITKRDDSVQKVRDRLLLMLSVCDILGSFGRFVSTWAIPKEDMEEAFVVFNIGNQATCDAQGFIIHFGSIGGALYNMSISVYFYLCIREGSRNVQMVEKVEPILHLISIGYPLGIAIFALMGDYFNAILSIGCYISEYPQGCIGDECVRGENAETVRVFGMLLPLAICMVVITVSMVLLYRTVKRQEGAITAYTRRWLSRPSIIRGERGTRPSVLSTQSHRVFKQAKLYIGAFVVVWIPPSFQLVIVNVFVDDPSIRFYSRLFTVIVGPSQGIFNMLVYMRYNPVQRLLRMITSSATRVSKLWSCRKESMTMDESGVGSELE